MVQQFLRYSNKVGEVTDASEGICDIINNCRV